MHSHEAEKRHTGERRAWRHALFGTALAVLATLAAPPPARAGAFEDSAIAFDNGDYARAVALLEPLARKGEARAQFRLGYLYEAGLGVPQDYGRAMEWYRRAADQGDANSQYNVGHLYATGLGVSVDFREAVKWFEKAALQGDPDAQAAMGLAYENGNGVPVDRRRAAEWFAKAAAQGDPIAKARLEALEGETGTSEP
jgi:uncharacterized protein